MRIIASVLLVLFLGGCVTKYKDMGFGGGVKAEQVTKDTYRISARGNAYTNAETIKDYALLKAAETTKQAGGTHFMILNNTNTTRQETVVSGGTATTNVYGSTAYTTYNPPIAETYIKPKA